KQDLLAMQNRFTNVKTESKYQLEYEYFSKIEKYLDSNKGSCWLKNPEIAACIAAALRHFDGERYRLFAWTIMPNHVHVLFEVLPGQSLSSIGHSWKSFTAHAANRILCRKGRFWEPESFDRLI